MRVIKEGKSNKERIVTCEDCDTVFAYTNNDIKYKLFTIGTIICPICKTAYMASVIRRNK